MEEETQNPGPGPDPEDAVGDSITGSISLVVSFVQQYGWLLLFVVIVAYYIRSKLQSRLDQWQSQREAASYKKMDSGVARDRMEAMDLARRKMQEQLDLQAKDFAEKQKKKEEEKRQQRIADWDGHQQGKGYRNKTRTTEAAEGASTSSTSGNKPVKPKQRLRAEYSPLMGDTDSGGSSRFRPAPRGGFSGGG